MWQNIEHKQTNHAFSAPPGVLVVEVFLDISKPSIQFRHLGLSILPRWRREAVIVTVNDWFIIVIGFLLLALPSPTIPISNPGVSIISPNWVVYKCWYERLEFSIRRWSEVFCKRGVVIYKMGQIFIKRGRFQQKVCYFIKFYNCFCYRSCFNIQGVFFHRASPQKF